MKQHYLLTSDSGLSAIDHSHLSSLYYGAGDSPFGPWFMAWDRLGLVYSNIMMDDQERHITELKKLFSVTEYITNDDQATEYIKIYFQSMRPPLNAHIIATPFQALVWNQTCHIPFGETISYKQLGNNINCRSPRAVGQALACNPIAFLIPCHRVIHTSGGFGNYSIAKHLLTLEERKQIKSNIIKWERQQSKA